MELGVMPLFRMAVALPILLLFVGGFSITLSSPLVIDSVVCRSDHVVHSSFNGKELFSINGYIVDNDSFCQAIILHYESNCTIGENLKNHCEWNHLSVGSLSEHKGDSIVYNFDKKSPIAEEHRDESLLPPNRVTMAMPGFFAVFCCLFCPCFRARRKETEHAVLVKESMHSESSVEMSSDKFPGSPARAPGSPLRVPASPLRVPPSPSRFGMSPKLSRLESLHLSLNQVVKATHNFSSALQIGEGGFGTVYKAQLQNGQFVAIKRAKKEHFETISTEFSSEVELLAKIDHRNLVKLLGYIDKGNERLIITEYVPNGTLREHLDGERGRPLDFNQRLEISIDIAHALTYLHLYAEKTIIHRDVKSSNILLTESYRAKVADFGFAKLGPADTEKTHISTKVKGTIGYLDPEYMRTFQLTPKSDVYSFGVLLLEILTGRRPVELKRPAEEKVTLLWAFKKYNARDVVTMVDPTMEVVNSEILFKMFGLAIQCAAPIRADRPDMKSVGEQLWAIRMNNLKRVRRG